MKVLVTGASGLLGKEICRQLKQDPNVELWAVDNHSRSSDIPPCDVWLKVDLLDLRTFDQLPKDFDQIYHYAAINGTKNFYERPNQVLANNMVGDLNMFAFAERCTNLQKIVYASSSEIVSGDPVSPVPEHTDIQIQNIHNPRWSYRLAKVCSENYLANSRLPWLMVRYFNIYGRDSKAGHFIADQMDKIRRGVFELVGGDETRSFCYVEDGVRATIHCANNVLRDTVNIGNDLEITIADAAAIIARKMGHEYAEWRRLPSLAGSTNQRRPDISKLRQYMPDYAPRTFEQGMSEILGNDQ